LVTYPMVRAYVADRLPQIAVEAGRGVVHAFIPQSHRPRGWPRWDIHAVEVI
jgi:hypothetical protein